MLELNSAQIKVTSYGKGRPLLLLPGWPFSSTIYKVLQPHLENEFKVTSFDLPGWCGKSSFKKPQRCGVNDYLDIIIKVIKILYKPDEKLQVGGISIGGTLALLLANEVDNIENVFIQSSPHRGDFFLKTKGLKTKLINKGAKSTLVGNLLKRFYKIQHMKTYWNNKKSLSKDLLDEVLEEYKTLMPQCVLEFACDFFQSDYSNKLKKIKNKTLVIACKNDSFVPPKFMRELSDLLPNSEYLEVDGVSHYFIVEKPKLFSELIISQCQL